jgi:hypothetical protein
MCSSLKNGADLDAVACQTIAWVSLFLTRLVNLEIVAHQTVAAVWPVRKPQLGCETWHSSWNRNVSTIYCSLWTSSLLGPPSYWWNGCLGKNCGRLFNTHIRYWIAFSNCGFCSSWWSIESLSCWRSSTIDFCRHYLAPHVHRLGSFPSPRTPLLTPNVTKSS